MAEVTDYLTTVKNHDLEAAARIASIKLDDGNVEAPLDMVLSDLRDQRLEQLLKQPNEWGHPALVAGIAEMHGLPQQDDKPQNIIVTAGTTPAFALVCESLLRQCIGTKVIVETPVYQPLARVPARLGATITLLPRRAEYEYRVQIDDFSRALNPETAFVVITNLHNPSGASLDSDNLREMEQALLKANPRAKIVVDETFHGFIRHERPSAATLGSTFIVVGGLSKVWGLSLLRTGWIVATENIINDVRPGWLDWQNIGSRLTEAVAATVMSRLEAYDQRWQTRLTATRPIVANFIERMQAAGLVESFMPSHGCICFPRILRGNVAVLLAKLRSERSVYLASGSHFGEPQHVRLGFGGPPEDLQKGLLALEEVIRDEVSA